MPQEKLVNIKLSEIKPNPNRDLKFNPFNEEKIVALMASIGETGFWTNVIVRKSPDGKGYEQAYGHHRIESARRSGITEAEFVVQNLDENMMLKMMELENQEDYRYCPLSLLESCKAVVNALAAGRIAPFVHADSTGRENTATAAVRYAPSFAPANTNVRPLKAGGLPYTVVDVAKFLGRERKHGKGVDADGQTRAAIDALYLLEVKAISTAQIKDMNWAQLGKFVADIKARRERVIIRETKTKAEITKINAESQRIQAEHKAEEKRLDDEHKALVKKMAEAKREEEKRDGMDAQIKSLSKQVENLTKTGIKTLIGEISRRDALASKLSGFVGAFDSAEMTLSEVAQYGVKKLGITCPAGHEQTALDCYLRDRKPAHEQAGFSLDAATSGEGKTTLDSFLKIDQ